jgi:hypothetical protein
VKVLAHEPSVADRNQVNIGVWNVTGQADETAPQHHMLQLGGRLVAYQRMDGAVALLIVHQLEKR